MNRSALLAAKAEELTASLEEWAKEILEPGEHLFVSLRIQNAPFVFVDPEDERANKEDILGMKLLKFLTDERLKKFCNERGIRTRTIKCLTDMDSRFRDMTVDHFVKNISEREVMRTLYFGRKCLVLLKQALADEGIAF